MSVPPIRIGETDHDMLAIRFSDKQLWAGFIGSYDRRAWAELEPVKIKGKVLSLGIDHGCAAVESVPSWDASAERTAYWLYDEYMKQFEGLAGFAPTKRTITIGPTTIRAARKEILSGGLTTDRKTCWIVSGDGHTPMQIGPSIVGLGPPGRQYSRLALQIFDVQTGKQIGPTFSLPIDRPWVFGITSIHIAEHNALIVSDDFGSVAWIVRLKDGAATPIPPCGN